MADIDRTIRERTASDAERVRREYERRAADPQLHRYYARVGAALKRQQTDRRTRIAAAFDSLGPRRSLRVLDVGCGRGRDLADLSRRGFAPENLVGIDLIESDLIVGRLEMPGLRLLLGNAAELPFSDGEFDGAMMITTLSSIVDDVVRMQAAREVARVVRPAGCIISYDLRVVGDKNPQLVPIDEFELRRLFADVGPMVIEHHALSLRVASRVPPWLASLLSTIDPLLHFILAVTRTNDAQADQ